MIHAKNGRGTTKAAVEKKIEKAASDGFQEAMNLERMIEQWVKCNPVVGLGLALAAGIGLGMLLKRRP
jgi:ElaB/YqjD/DUF883 family membrane-anchored ribosome-binding protein